MKKQLLIFPSIVFFFILLVFIYLLIIERDPTELPSVLIEKKLPRLCKKSIDCVIDIFSLDVSYKNIN